MGLTDYETFDQFREDYYSGTAASGGEADMDMEYLLSRVYGGTNWYVILELEQTMDTYDTQYERLALDISNREELGDPEAMIQREKQLPNRRGLTGCFRSPSRDPHRNTARIWQCGAF